MIYQLMPSSSAATGPAETGGSTDSSSGRPEKSSSAGSATAGYWKGSCSDMGACLYLENTSKSFVISRPTAASTMAKYAAKAKTAMITTVVVARTCFQVGQVTRRISCCSSSK